MQPKIGLVSLVCTISDVMAIQWNCIKCQSLMLLLNKNVYLDQNLALLLTIRHAPHLVTTQLQDRLGLVVCTTSDVIAIEGNRTC